MSSITTNDNEFDNSNESRLATTIIGVAGFILLPSVALSAFAVWALFSWGRIRRSVIAASAGIYALLLLMVNIFVPVFQTYVETFTVKVPALIADPSHILNNYLEILLLQTPVNLIIGVLVGLAYTTYRWITRPKWEEYKFRLTPYQIWKRKKNIEDIAHNKNSPHNGTTLGISMEDGHKVVQTDKEASAHTIVVGASGSGKTTTLMSQARDIIGRGHGLIFVDLKGGTDVPRILEEFTRRENANGRKTVFRHWIMQSPTAPYTGPSELGPAFYDPLNRGEATRRKDLIIATRKYEGNADYYKNIAEDYLQKAFTVLIANPNQNVSVLEDLTTLLDPRILADRAHKLSHIEAYRPIVESINRMVDERLDRAEKEVISSLRTSFSNLSQSIAGSWIRLDPKGLDKTTGQYDTDKGNNIDLFRAAQENEVIVFSLDSSNYPVLSQTLGNLIIQDLMTVSSELRQKEALNPIHVFIDEFAAIESANIYNLVNKSRDAGMPISLSTQALGDLDKVGTAFRAQLFGIVNAFIIHRANTRTDAEEYSGLTGTVIKKKFRQSVSHEKNLFGMGRGRGAGTGMVEDVEEAVVTVPEIQRLKTGELIYVSKADGIKVERVKVIPEDGAVAESNNVPKPTLNMEGLMYSDSREQAIPETPTTVEVVLDDANTYSGEVKHADKERLASLLNIPVEEAYSKVNGVENKSYESKVLPPTTTPVAQPAETVKPNIVLPTNVSAVKADTVSPLDDDFVLPAPKMNVPGFVKPDTAPTPVVEVEEEVVETPVEPKPAAGKDEFDF